MAVSDRPAADCRLPDHPHVSGLHLYPHLVCAGSRRGGVDPWLLAAGATWRLWTAKDRVDREHHDLLVDRMGGASLFLMALCSITVAACVIAMMQLEAARWDKIVCGCYLIAAVCSVVLFSRRKSLEMDPVENPENFPLMRRRNPQNSIFSALSYGFSTASCRSFPPCQKVLPRFSPGFPRFQRSFPHHSTPRRESSWRSLPAP